MNEKMLAKARLDVAEGKARAAAIALTLTPEVLAKAEAMRAAARTVLARTFVTGSNAKGRVEAFVLPELAVAA